MKPKYPGISNTTFNELEEFTKRLLTKMGFRMRVDYTDSKYDQFMSMSNFQVRRWVAEVYHEMTREEMEE